MRKTCGERKQRFAGAGLAEQCDEVDFGIHQQVQRKILLTIARRDTPNIVFVVRIVAQRLQQRRFAVDLTHLGVERRFAIVRLQVDELVDQENSATPSFYGGASVNYILKDKWNINTSLYYYGKQTFVMNRSYNMYGTDHISAKALVNVKVSYEFMKNNEVFVNVRNLLDDRSNEFAFADEIGAKFFGGVNLTF